MNLSLYKLTLVSCPPNWWPLYLAVFFIWFALIAFGIRYIIITAITDILIAKDSGEALPGDSYYAHMINFLTWTKGALREALLIRTFN